MLTMADISLATVIQAAGTLQQQSMNMTTLTNNVYGSVEEYYKVLQRAHDAGMISWSVVENESLQ